MKNLLLLLLFPAFAFGKWPPPSQEEAQAIFDSAVSEADEAIAEAVLDSGDTEEESLVLVWKAVSTAEIRKLSEYFRLEIPPPTKEVVDGKEVWSYSGFRCGCRGEFVITLKKGGATLLSFGMAHGEHIASDVVREDSAVRISRESLAPFYFQLVQAAKKKEANKPVSQRRGANAPQRG